MSRRSIIGIVIAVWLAAPEAAQSQGSVSLDVTIGSITGASSRHHYYSGGEAAGEITLGLRPHPDRTMAWMAGVTVGGRGRLGHGDICRLATPPDSGCAPPLPALSHLGLLGGGEWRWSVASVRAHAGPAFYGGEGASGVGGQLHLDAAVGFRHLAVVAATYDSWIARVGGETLHNRAREFGLRVQ